MLFELARLDVAAVEDGEVAVFAVFADFAQVDVADDLFGFAFVGARGDDVYALAFGQGGPQGFFDDVRVVGDQGVGDSEDFLVAAVVLFEFDGFQGRVVFVQVGDVFRTRTAPGVDGLVVITNSGEGGGCADEQLQQLVLAIVGVLVFVDEQVADAMLPAGAHIVVVFEKGKRQGDEVVEIDGVVSTQAFVVVVVDVRGQHLFVVLGEAARGGGRDVGVFVGRYLRLYLPDLRVVFLFAQFFDEGRAVAGIEDGEVAPQSCRQVFFLQNVEAQAVKG